MITTRRRFLQQGLGVVSVGLGVPLVFGKALAASAAEAGSLPANGKTLVVVQLAGGLDGLSAVVPYSDGAYHDARRRQAIPEENLLLIDERVAFNAAMAGMKELFDAGKLAVIEGVGYPNPSFSHFRAMEIWQSANPNGPAEDGWLGRYFEELVDGGGHPLAGLAVGRSVPAAFQAATVGVPTVESVDTFGLQDAASDPAPEARRSVLMHTYDAYSVATTRYAALLDRTLDQAYESEQKLKAAHAAYKAAVAYPNTSLARGLRLLAELIDSGPGPSPLRVGHVTLGGFDTHTMQAQRLTPLLTELSEALSAFWRDMEAHGRAEDVLVMTWSEFGRRVAENAQNGFDHGSAGPMFVLGGRVKGGFYGEPPSLRNLDDGNLRFTTDFRSVYASVLEGWLEAPAETVLGGRFESLKILST